MATGTGAGGGSASLELALWRSMSSLMRCLYSGGLPSVVATAARASTKQKFAIVMSYLLDPLSWPAKIMTPRLYVWTYRRKIWLEINEILQCLIVVFSPFCFNKVTVSLRSALSRLVFS